VQDETRLTLRLPAALAALLRQRASADHRSLNSEIVALLEQATSQQVDADAYAAGRRLLQSTTRYSVPRPFGRRDRGNGGGSSA
jgi:hypothetical protein